MIFRIYNRYGQLIFESTEIDDPGWDGTVNGKEEKSGTFLYTLEYTLLDGTSGTKSGNVTLIR
jgi:gliding motility-associated-like protein